MEQFTNYLISKSIVADKQVQYYVGWVKAFLLKNKKLSMLLESSRAGWVSDEIGQIV